MRSIEDVCLVLALVEKGLNDCEISRETGIPRRTILGWRHGRVPRFAMAYAAVSCPRCGHPRHDSHELPVPAYTYLLGLYLGDGFIAKHPRTYRLTIFMDRPGISLDDFPLPDGNLDTAVMLPAGSVLREQAWPGL